MKTSATLFILFGIVYLYLLEDIGNWITRDLPAFEAQHKKEKEMFKSGAEFATKTDYKRALFRLPIDDLIDVLYNGDLKEEEPEKKIELTNTEYLFIEKSIVGFEDLLRDEGDDKPSYVERNKKWPTES